MSREIESIWPGWRISGMIGEGSFGRVYKITREEFGHVYESALKVIEIPKSMAELDSIRNEGLSDQEITAYFKGIVEDIVKEFELMSQLKGDSNIVSYEDHTVVEKKDSFGWRIYIRMELLTPLFSYLKTHPFSVRDVILLGIDICKALEVCQKCNIIHRDIKPENIFVSKLGRYKLGDFGIARQLEKSTSVASKTGTPTYMAPEVYKGEKYHSNVDVYSLGLVLYRFLNSNRMPFLPPAPQPIRYSDRQNANLLRMSGKEIPKPCRAEGRLSEIVLKACAYDPKERYESAHELRRALESILYTESEGKLIFPEGDFLNEAENEYIGSAKKEARLLSAKKLRSRTDRTLPLMGADTTLTQPTDSTLPDDDRTVPDEAALSETEPRSVKEPVTEKQHSEETQDSDQKEDAKAPPVIPAEKPAAPAEETLEKRKSGKKVLIPIVLAAAAAVAGIVVLIILLAGGNSGTPAEDASSQVSEVSEVARVAVPNLVNLTVEDAEKALKKKGLTLKETKREFSETVAKGKVISQAKKKNTQVAEGSVIGVVVSKGTETVAVPSVVGETREDAEKDLKKLGFSCEFEEAYSGTVPYGSVVSQSVAAKKSVKKGTSVTLTVSLGTEPVYEAPVYQETPAYQEYDTTQNETYDNGGATGDSGGTADTGNTDTGGANATEYDMDLTEGGF